MRPPRPYLLFSSVGDSYNRAVENWCRASSMTERMYDILLVYYGNDAERFTWLASRCDHIYWSKGSKFQNFVRLYQPLSLSRYSYLWIADDDISLNPQEVNLLFGLTDQHGLAASQPSLSRYGMISYPIQIAEFKSSIIRYTNFIEVTCPVLSREVASRLVSIIQPFSDRLTCYGIDIIMTHYIHGPDSQFGIIDAVRTRNPYPIEKKDGVRECLRIADEHTLRRTWEAVRQLLPSPIPPMDPEIFEYGSVSAVRP